MNSAKCDKRVLKRSLAAKPFPQKEAEKYLDDFNTMFRDDSIFNVAITGSFGAGKSSLIQWAINNYPQHSFHVISVSSFAKGENVKFAATNSDSEDDRDKIRFSVESGIINQLVHSSNANDASRAGFYSLTASSKSRIFLMALYISAIIGFTYVFLNGLIKEHIWLQLSILCILILVAIYHVFLYGGFRRYFSSLSIGKVNIALAEKQTSAINSNLDSLLYLLHQSKDDVYVFEDIDRFDSLSIQIFETLRELNRQANQTLPKPKSHKVGHNLEYHSALRVFDNQYPSAIRFIYLIREDLFSSKDLVKFFDYVIPVIPCIDIFNSSNMLMNEFATAGLNVSKETCTLIYPGFEDLRILNNLINEACLYKKIANTRLGYSDDQLVCALTYKLLFPQDYSLFQKGRGFLYSLFNMLSSSKLQSAISLEDNRLFDAQASSNDCLTLYISDMLNMHRDEELFKYIHDEYVFMSDDSNYRVLRNLLQERRLSYSSVRFLSKPTDSELLWPDWDFLNCIEFNIPSNPAAELLDPKNVIDRLPTSYFSHKAMRNFSVFKFLIEASYKDKLETFICGIEKDIDYEFIIKSYEKLNKCLNQHPKLMKRLGTLIGSYLDDSHVGIAAKRDCIYTLLSNQHDFTKFNPSLKDSVRTAIEADCEFLQHLNRRNNAGHIINMASKMNAIVRMEDFNKVSHANLVGSLIKGIVEPHASNIQICVDGSVDRPIDGLITRLIQTSNLELIDCVFNQLNCFLKSYMTIFIKTTQKIKEETSDSVLRVLCSHKLQYELKSKFISLLKMSKLTDCSEIESPRILLRLIDADFLTSSAENWLHIFKILGQLNIASISNFAVINGLPIELASTIEGRRIYASVLSSSFTPAEYVENTIYSIKLTLNASELPRYLSEERLRLFIDLSALIMDLDLYSYLLDYPKLLNHCLMARPGELTQLLLETEKPERYMLGENQLAPKTLRLKVGRFSSRIRIATACMQRMLDGSLNSFQQADLAASFCDFYLIPLMDEYEHFTKGERRDACNLFSKSISLWLHSGMSVPMPEEPVKYTLNHCDLNRVDRVLLSARFLAENEDHMSTYDVESYLVDAGLHEYVTGLNREKVNIPFTAEDRQLVSVLADYYGKDIRNYFVYSDEVGDA